MYADFIYPEYEVVRNYQRCIACRACERQCANEVHRYDADEQMMTADDAKCVNCHRCVSLCPTRALKIVRTDHTFKENANWTKDNIQNVYRQAATGGVLLSSMGNPEPLPGYWDRILINASQVTNPPIDPLREPMETRVFLGKKDMEIRRDENGAIVPKKTPHIELAVPIMFSAMSYGSISYNAHESLARAATELGVCYNTGEGGLHEDFYRYGPNTIVQVASGRFGVHSEYLNAGAAVEIKMGQGAKPGIGGHLPGAKIVGDVARTRMVPEGADAISPAPHHDIYSIEDLRQLVNSLKEATHYEKPIIVKIAAVHNVAAIASGIARSGADIIAIDGFRGGTGAAPTVAEIAREAGALTVGVVTKPFKFEGKRRMDQALGGINSLLGKVDSLLIIPNDRLKYATDQKVTLANAFEIADDVLRQAVTSISDLIKNTGFINLDFADVTTIMKDAGFAHMGVGHAVGKGKAEEAAKMAVASPLMETSINGAHGVLINVTGSEDMGLEDVEAAANLVQEAAHPDANIIFGATFDNSLDDEIRVTVIATGFEEGRAKVPGAETAAKQAAPSEGLFTQAQQQAAQPQQQAAPAQQAPAQQPQSQDDDPYDTIFKIFNSR